MASGRPVGVALCRSSCEGVRGWGGSYNRRGGCSCILRQAARRANQRVTGGETARGSDGNRQLHFFFDSFIYFILLLLLRRLSDEGLTASPPLRYST